MALSLKLYVPDVQIRNLGPITIGAEVAGQQLPSLTLSKPMEYTYSARVPAAALRSGYAVVNFHLDKSSIGLNGDARELGVVVTEVESRTTVPGAIESFGPPAGFLRQQEECPDCVSVAV